MIAPNVESLVFKANGDLVGAEHGPRPNPWPGVLHENDKKMQSKCRKLLKRAANRTPIPAHTSRWINRVM